MGCRPSFVGLWWATVHYMWGCGGLSPIICGAVVGCRLSYVGLRWAVAYHMWGCGGLSPIICGAVVGIHIYVCIYMYIYI